MTHEVNIDLIANGSANGEVASYMLGKGRMDPGSMKPFIYNGKAYITVYKGSGDPSVPESYASVLVSNATLLKDEWKLLDEAVLRVSETRLGGVQDLITNGLVYNLGNAMGTTVLEWQDVSDALTAELTMDGVPRAKNDRPEYTTKYLPIPIIHADYEINSRVLAASRTLGNPLDTTLAERAARKVNYKLESLLFTNTSYGFGGGTIYSYVNFPYRSKQTLSTNWDASAKTAALIVDEVLSMKQASIADYHYGPWMLYIPTAYETVLDADYTDSLSTGSTNTIRERILKIEGIRGIKVVDTLPANNVLLVEMNSETVRLVRGMGIQNVEWETEGKFIHKFKVMTIQVPQIRADQEGRSGIVHLASSATHSSNG